MYVRTMKTSSSSPEQQEDVPQRATGWGDGGLGVNSGPTVGGAVGPEALASILDLDGGATLARLRSGRRTAWRVEAEQMVAATHWADLHRLPTPEPDETDPVYGSVSDETAGLLGDHVTGTEGMTWGRDAVSEGEGGGQGRRCGEGRAEGDGEGKPSRHEARATGPGQPGIEGVLRFLGEGAYLVPEFAVTELATTLQTNESGARNYLGQALECRDRLPRIWRQVLAGAVPAWKARQIAKLTLPLNAAAAHFVDLSLHQVAGRIGIVRITRAVEAAVLRYDPELASDRAEKAAERRGVWVGPDCGTVEDGEGRSGLTRVDALVDTPDAEAFELAVADVAAALGALGDDDPLPVRRAKAVGILADPQHALDVAAAAQADPAVDPETGAARRRPRRRGPVAGRSLVIDLHLHLTPAGSCDPTHGAHAGTGAGPEHHPSDGVPACPVGPVVRDGDLGPVARAAVERWLTQLAPGARIRVRPVLDLADDMAVDAHEVPQGIADQVDERDLVCQFPWCGRPARSSSTDRDHIEPYLPPEDSGPPGQTSAKRLARLCRYHHRVKTYGGWRYRREPSGALTWVSPHRQVYRVDRRGTSSIEIPGPEPDPD